MDGTWPIYRLFIAYVSRHCDFPSHSIATCCSKLAEGVYRSSRWFVVFLRLKILQILKSVADMWKRRWWSTNLSQRSKLIQLPFFRSLIGAVWRSTEGLGDETGIAAIGCAWQQRWLAEYLVTGEPIEKAQRLASWPISGTFNGGVQYERG